MKYLFFIMLIVASCREPWRPKPRELETPKSDSVYVVDTDSTRLNFVVLKNEKYFFIGIKSNLTILKRITDTVMLDSLARDVKESKRNVMVYRAPDVTYPEFKQFIDALRRKEIFKFSLITDNKLNELRIEN